MTSLEQPILISFKLCPFVQRAVITLLHKKIDFTIEYINLQKKPDWFLEISPLGKVPLLRVKDHVLFESAVINEYLDEAHGDPMLPKDPLEKAASLGELMAFRHEGFWHCMDVKRDRDVLEALWQSGARPWVQ